MGHENVYDVLEQNQERLLQKAIDDALDGNTAILGKLLDKILPNLNKVQNMNINLDATSEMIDDITKSIGVIESLERSVFSLGEGQKVELQITEGDQDGNS